MWSRFVWFRVRLYILPKYSLIFILRWTFGGYLLTYACSLMPGWHHFTYCSNSMNFMISPTEIPHSHSYSTKHLKLKFKFSLWCLLYRDANSQIIMLVYYLAPFKWSLSALTFVLLNTVQPPIQLCPWESQSCLGPYCNWSMNRSGHSVYSYIGTGSKGTDH